jgi:hypothetical protein
MITGDLSRDHAELHDTAIARRYFAKFERITGHLARVVATMEAERTLSKSDVAIIRRYVQGVAATFRALGNKYFLTGRLGQNMTFDRHESGFPVFQELLSMANDAQQADRHLTGLPSAAVLKDEMIRQIVAEQTIPTELQFAMSQRLYYEALLKGDLFWARNDPEILWLDGVQDRRRYLVFWAVYDGHINLPTIYLMEVEDTGRTPLPKDQRRWPEAQTHLMAQSVAGLKLLTIAKGFDESFDDLHPKRLRRFHIGPMYSHAFTMQSGPIREVLEEAKAAAGEDWALAWTMEELTSERVEDAAKGWFGSVEREIFALDPFAGRGADTGATRTTRSIIMPLRPYQMLEEMKPAGFHDVRKFVVSPQGSVVSYR